VADSEWKSRPASIIESNGGVIAVVIDRGVGRNPGSLVQEISKNGTPRKKQPYWISCHSKKWRSKGRCIMHSHKVGTEIEFGFSSLELFETIAPYNPCNISVTYIVEVIENYWKGFLKPAQRIHKIRVKATSGENAIGIVAGNPEKYGFKPLYITVTNARPLTASD
jgi:hypothetical protein